MEALGYRNAEAAYRLMASGRLSKKRGDNIALDMTASMVLLDMCFSTYDWPPTAKLKGLGKPCRYYALGWRSIAEDHSMILLTPEQAMSDDAERYMASREATAKKRISNAWRFLKEQGLIKQLTPASLGKNAGYLLLIGDDEENRQVEKWARECLGLPLVW